MVLTGDDRSHTVGRGTHLIGIAADGELSIRCGSDTLDAPAGSFMFLPRGRPHRFWAKPAARLLLIAVPGGIEDYFHQINHVLDDPPQRRGRGRRCRSGG
jgi:hypothetical protein